LSADLSRGETPGKNETLTKMSAGIWGGPGILLSISSEGATIEYDCGQGTIERLEVDGAGRFHAQGTYEEEKGPSVVVSAVREDGATSPAAKNTPRKSVHYEGAVTGAEMTLTAILQETGQPLGSFRLRRGEPPRLHKCR
jgi:hypothetical protein